VADVDNRVVGHVVFSPVTSEDGDGPPGYILAPLAVHPDFQKHGVGSRLVATGLAQLAGEEVCFVLVYGDPKYYARFGFGPDCADRFISPYKLQYPFGWQVVALNGCDLGGPAVKVSCVASLSDPALW
jgi:putative acetyltransferase